MGNEKIIQLFVEAGANPFELNVLGNTVKDIAIKKGIFHRYFEECAVAESHGPFALNLSSLSMYRFPTFLWKYPSITSLEIQNNHLTSIPAEIHRLSYLQTLNVASNSLQSLPAELGLLSSLSFLNIDGNPLFHFPSPDLVPRKTQKILDFLRKLKRDDILWKRVKVMWRKSHTSHIDGCVREGETQRETQRDREIERYKERPEGREVSTNLPT
jgi:hypothetical protein